MLLLLVSVGDLLYLMTLGELSAGQRKIYPFRASLSCECGYLIVY
jgi:hypothetical protein